MKYLLILLLSIIFFSCVIEKPLIKSNSNLNHNSVSYTWNDWNSSYSFNPYWNHWYWNDWYWNNCNYSYNWNNWQNWNKWNHYQNHNWDINRNHKKIRTNIYDIPFNKPKFKMNYEKRKNN